MKISAEELQCIEIMEARRPSGDLNKHHPEARPGEVFLCNIPDHELPGNCSILPSIKKFKTARRGETAYTSYNEEIDNMRPVFVSTEEYQEHHGE